MTTVRLGLIPIWNPAGKPKNAATHTALVLQAYHTAARVQRVTISSPDTSIRGLPKTVESDPTKPMGTAFWSEELNLGNDTPQSTPLYFDVTIHYKDDKGWADPAVLAVQGTQLGPSCVAAHAFANDAGDDADYNDTVVSISLFPYSRD